MITPKTIQSSSILELSQFFDLLAKYDYEDHVSSLKSDINPISVSSVCTEIGLVADNPDTNTTR